MRARISDFCCWCWGDLPKSVVENLVCTVRSDVWWNDSMYLYIPCLYLSTWLHAQYVTVYSVDYFTALMYTRDRSSAKISSRHSRQESESIIRTTRILLLFLILLFLVTMNGDAKNHSTMRRTTVNHVVMLSAPFLFIFGIISLASMRERNMDLHHSRHHEWVYHHVPPWCWCWESSEWNCFFVVE